MTDKVSIQTLVAWMCHFLALMSEHLSLIITIDKLEIQWKPVTIFIGSQKTKGVDYWWWSATVLIDFIWPWQNIRCLLPLKTRCPLGLQLWWLKNTNHVVLMSIGPMTAARRDGKGASKCGKKGKVQKRKQGARRSQPSSKAEHSIEN